MQVNEFYFIKLFSKKMISRDIMELRFAKPAGFVFRAGQFVRFQIPALEGVVLRPFSISAAPREDYLEFCAKILPEGKASAYFVQLDIGMTASATPAQGVFVCDPGAHPRKLFIATGAGLAPIISMVEDRLFSSADVIQLLFGVRTPQDVFWSERLDKLKNKFSNFSYRLTVSRPDDAWQGLRGRVLHHLHYSLLTTPYSLTEYYICGSVEMVKDVRTALLGKGANTKSIHFEIF